MKDCHAQYRDNRDTQEDQSRENAQYPFEEQTKNLDRLEGHGRQEATPGCREGQRMDLGQDTEDHEPAREWLEGLP